MLHFVPLSHPGRGIRHLSIERYWHNLLGGGGGAVIGGLLGNQVGGGSGKNIATAVGALGGAIAGTAAEDASNRIAAWEMEIRTDAGEDIVVVQRADRPFEPGQRVRLIGSGRNLSVAPY